MIHKLVAATLISEMCESLINQIEDKSNSFLERRLRYSQLDKTAKGFNPSWIEADGYNTLIAGKYKRESLEKELRAFGLENYYKDLWKFNFLESESVSKFTEEIGERNIEKLKETRLKANELLGKK